MAATPQIRVIARFKNDRLIALREKAGLTQKEMAQRLACSASTYAGLENLRTYPHNQKSGEWRPVTKALADEFGNKLDWLFPARVIQGQIDTVIARMESADLDRTLAWFEMDVKARAEITRSTAWRVGDK